jgi:hypothetical protein
MRTQLTFEQYRRFFALFITVLCVFELFFPLSSSGAGPFLANNFSYRSRRKDVPFEAL